MSVERSFEAWEEVQRHGQDLADRLAQGFTGMIPHINPPPFAWPNPQKAKLFDLEFPSQSFGIKDFGFEAYYPGIDGVSAIFDIGNRIGQAGADFGACLNGMVQQFFRRLPVPFRQEETVVVSVRADGDKDRHITDLGITMREDLGTLTERLKGIGFAENDNGSDGLVQDEVAGINTRSAGLLGRPQGIVNITSTYDSRTREVESSLAARGDLWRVEASHGSSTSGNGNSSLFLVQLGPLLFVRDSTLLLPVHLSKQHLLWYGYDRKNGMHSLCPAVWSKHRRWLLMSMLCLNPLACSFVDLQFPNGQLTYVSGEGLTTSAFLPVCGGLLQAQGQYPGEMRFSFSCKNKWGTRITPVVQWPDKSFTLGLAQALAWQRSGLMVRPTIQFSLCPTFGGSNPGLRTELIHSVKEKLNLICGCAFTTYPSAFASVSIGRSKWNGNVGSSGLVLRVDAPLSNTGRPSFNVQVNSGIEF
ncbi:Epstein-barr nuclear antigen [Quillaja saponaria]|uniref:Epstein-barr nuclear antigen n=1 Tax=Quillaja saponaria TaxID=32244 RepID=A0AAD7VND1_QUISA|nr:Epstein-barr nuclear antigen [Quillaja saponaria]